MRKVSIMFVKQYKNCSCVGKGNQTYDALPNRCKGSCDMQLAAYLIILALLLLSSFLIAIPALSATLRYVNDQKFVSFIVYLYIRKVQIYHEKHDKTIFVCSQIVFNKPK